MLISEFDYDLPDDRIAQHPLGDRADSRLLVDKGSARPGHRSISDLPDLIRPGDLIVVNDTKVLPARIPARKPTGGGAEVLLLTPDGPAAVALAAERSRWEVLVRPSKSIPPGTRLSVDNESDLAMTIDDDLGEGRRIAVVESSDLDAALQRVGRMPLPPYIKADLDDPDRYQTVYARTPGSAAAPTAGLHLTADLLDEIEERGAEVATVDLVVGLDTFRPVTVESLDDHAMHSERYQVPNATADALARVDERNGRVVAVGTTTVRALESAARFGPSGSTELFIRRPFDFLTVDLLLTNFHMPRSTLLVMIDAFIGSRWRTLYEIALADHYRFLSFGDAMLLDRHAT